MIKAIIFDLGDVIVKVDRTEQFRKFSAKSCKDAFSIRQYLDGRIKGEFGIGEISPRQFYQRVCCELGLKMSFEEFKKEWCGIFKLNTDVAQLIENLKGKFKLILLSNTDALHFPYIRNKFKVINAFDELILSYEIGCMKPNPLIFLNALKKAKTLPFNCVYIDDIPEFVYVARLMGIRAFQYKNFKKLKSDLSKVGILTKTL